MIIFAVMFFYVCPESIFALYGVDLVMPVMLHMCGLDVVMPVMLYMCGLYVVMPVVLYMCGLDVVMPVMLHMFLLSSSYAIPTVSISK